MVLLILTESYPLEALKTVIRRAAYVLLPLSVTLIKYFRELGVAYTEDGATTMWIGVTTHKNVLGYVMMVCMLYFLNNSLWHPNAKRLIKDGFFVAMILWITLGTSDSKSSSTSLAALGVGMVLLFLVRMSKGDLAAFRRNATVGFVALGAAGLVYWFSRGGIGESLSAHLGRDATFTGRTEIWSIVLAIGPGNWLVGRGYGSFWSGSTARAVWSALTYHTHFTQSHNGYIDIYLELGAVGVVLLCLVIFSTFKSIGSALRADPEYASYKLAFLCAIIVHNLTESSFGRPTHLVWFIFLLACTSVLPKRKTNARVRLHGPT